MTTGKNILSRRDKEIMKKSNDISEMTADQRLTEVAAILAAGILRYRLRQREKHGKTELSFLDNGHRTSPYETSTTHGFERRRS